MRASEINLLKFIKKSSQFVIPIYQRNYSWTNEQCAQLWNDILRAGQDKNTQTHFIGSVVYVERALSTVSNQEALLVIDGQQRLTTCTLLISALATYFERYAISELLQTFSTRKLRNYYLTNPEEGGERYYKLILSENDNETLRAIINQTPISENTSIRIAENYALFQKWIEEYTNQNPQRLAQICQGLEKLTIVEIALDRNQDNPQLIFESMNSTGLALSQADLIRNYILMGLEPHLQNRLYQNYWRKIEQNFGQEAYAKYFDGFMRHYLTAKTGEIPNIQQVYHSFKLFSQQHFAHDVHRLIADMAQFARYYCACALDKETEPKLKRAFADLRELKVDVAYPLLLNAYHHYHQKHIHLDEMVQVVRLIESYVFRRAVCDIPTNSLNKTFANLAELNDNTHYLTTLQYQLLSLPSYRRFPRDDEFLSAIQTRDVYNFGRRIYLLRHLENHNRKENVDVNEYTIEHIMPQNPHLCASWQEELGENWQHIQQTYLHTLGNLTLTAYNSEYSDHDFTYKREKIKNNQGELIGLKYSPLRLNLDFAHATQWNEATIKQRAQRLANIARDIWSLPTMPKLVASISTMDKTVYHWEDNDYLQPKSAIYGLFLYLRQQILALDPCVNEISNKHYVSYKAETNFVDITPQMQCLRLCLNMSFADIYDPRGLCRDVSNIAHWGNGEVDVRLAKSDDVPYVMGLIRQAFDAQIEKYQ